MTFVYNGILLVLDAAALWAVRRSRRWGRRLAALGGVAFFAIALALVLGEDHFGQIRLLSYGLFGHGVLMGVGTAAVLRRVRWWTRAGFLAAALALGTVAIDAFLIEPRRLEVTHLTFRSAKLAAAVRMVVLADLQTSAWGPYEESVLRRAAEERPDLVFFLGDYLQGWRENYRGEMERFPGLVRASGLTAPMGMFAVRGNCEPDVWPRLFEGLPVEVIEETRGFEVGPLRLTGLSQADSRQPGRIEGPGDRFHVVVGHHPDFAMGDVRADLLVAGHTHGGQVRLPLLGPLMTLSRVPRRWAAGVTDLGGGRTLVVSRGIGMERRYAPRLRFLCRPELLVIDLQPARA